MSTVIITCSNMRHHIDMAQKKEHTCYPVIELSSKLHAEPKDMREKLFETLNTLPGDVNLVLLSLGLCGGSATEKPFPVRTVMPKVDDCITLLLHVDDRWFPNLKKGGHLYLTDGKDDTLSVPNIYQNLTERYGEKKGEFIFDKWFEAYKSVDIIDTGAYDCRTPEYLAAAQRDAAMIGCDLTFVEGSNRLLEKLVGGRWDDQFLRIEKGTILHEEDFLI